MNGAPGQSLAPRNCRSRDPLSAQEAYQEKGLRMRDNADRAQKSRVHRYSTGPPVTHAVQRYVLVLSVAPLPISLVDSPFFRQVQRGETELLLRRKDELHRWR